MCTPDTMEPYTRHKRQHKARWTTWALQPAWNNIPDTMYATRRYGPICTADTSKPYTIHYVHLQTLHTPGNRTQIAIYTTNNHGHHAHGRDQATIQQTQWTLQGSMDNADNREPYNRQYAHHQAQWTTWAMDTRRHNTADTLDTTRNRRHHVCLCEFLCLSLCQCQLQGQSKPVSL